MLFFMEISLTICRVDSNAIILFVDFNRAVIWVKIELAQTQFVEFSREIAYEIFDFIIFQIEVAQAIQTFENCCIQ